MTHVEVVSSRPHPLGESPLWDHRAGRLLWVDSLKQCIYSLDSATGLEDVIELPVRIGSIGLRKGNGLIAGTKAGFATIDPADGAFEIVAPVEAEIDSNRLNDGKCDPAGRYWCGSMNESFAGPTGALYRLDPDFHAIRMFDGVIVSNGIAFSPQADRMYFADSRRRTVHVFDYDGEAGELANRRVFIDFNANIYGRGDGRADGATIDTDGNYWCALVFGGAVGCFDRKGKPIERIELPVTHPTMCAFGGPELDILYVTSATCLLDDPKAESEAGKLFAITGLGARGSPEPVFAG